MALARGGNWDDDFFSSQLGRHPLISALSQIGNGDSSARNIPMDIKEVGEEAVQAPRHLREYHAPNTQESLPCAEAGNAHSCYNSIVTYIMVRCSP